MPTTYSEETGMPKGQLEKLTRNKFGELWDAKVSFTMLMASNEDGPAVKHHGVPCFAKIKINGLSDRAEGKADVTITIDAKRWEEATEREREAVLAHELRHLVVKRKKNGDVKLDDLGRPKLGTIPDDYSINGFFDNVREYGEDAPERKTLMEVCGQYKQRNLWDAWG